MTSDAASLSINPAPLARVDPSNAAVEAYDNVFYPAAPIKCILFSASLCHAVHDKPVLGLAVAQAAVLVSDGVTTRQIIKRGYVEVDPVVRVFVGRQPTWRRMAPLGAVQVLAGAWLAEQMRTSRHARIRRFWWLPQMIRIAGNASATVHNLTLHR